MMHGTSLLGAVQLAGAPMWPLRRLATTDENAFLRMTGWRSTYTADPTGEESFCLWTSSC
ncbi:hypothetical protein J6590_077629 [Homalodisca vitripennis]|nr:hypothetical protein J6590_077629 [Homalodisca vitripennis]